MDSQHRQQPCIDNSGSVTQALAGSGSLGRVLAVPVLHGKDRFGWLLALGTAESPELGSVEASLLTAVAAILATHRTNVKLFSNIKDLFLGVVHALSSAIDAKDPYTCGHSDRVARVARWLGKDLGLTEDEVNRLYLSGLLHDVGKIGIKDSVLLKPGRLTEEEFAHIKLHPTIGFEILSGVKQLKPVLPGVRHHHENYDGTGYPGGLEGETIPLMARILAVADSYDAMSSNRPYRNGMSRDKVLRIFREGAGKQWDTRVVQALLKLEPEIRRKLATAAATPAPAHQIPVCGSGSHEISLAKISNLIPLTSD